MLGHIHKLMGFILWNFDKHTATSAGLEVQYTYYNHILNKYLILSFLHVSIRKTLGSRNSDMYSKQPDSAADKLMHYVCVCQFCQSRCLISFGPNRLVSWFWVRGAEKKHWFLRMLNIRNEQIIGTILILVADHLVWHTFGLSNKTLVFVLMACPI